MPDTYNASILVVNNVTRSIDHFPVQVIAISKAEAIGKLTIASRRLFPHGEIHVKLGELGVMPVDDPEKATLLNQPTN